MLKTLALFKNINHNMLTNISFLFLLNSLLSISISQTSALSTCTKINIGFKHNKQLPCLSVCLPKTKAHYKNSKCVVKFIARLVESAMSEAESKRSLDWMNSPSATALSWPSVYSSICPVNQSDNLSLQRKIETASEREAYTHAH